MHHKRAVEIEMVPYPLLGSRLNERARESKLNGKRIIVGTKREIKVQATISATLIIDRRSSSHWSRNRLQVIQIITTSYYRARMYFNTAYGYINSISFPKMIILSSLIGERMRRGKAYFVCCVAI